MKMKKVLALALAGAMVFSMTACGGEKDDKKSNTEKKEVSVETVVDEFNTLFLEKNGNYSFDSVMTMKMEVEGETMSMEMKGTSNSYDGVTYSKTTTKSEMSGESEEVVQESYIITKKDGSVVSAMKNDDDEWIIVVTDAEDIETAKKAMGEIDLEALKKSAKMEKKDDICIVTMEISSDQIGMSEDALMGNMEGLVVEAVVTYSEKNDAITNIEINFDLESLNEIYGSLGGKVSEWTMKMENIKKTDKAIEIPSEIELD